MGLVSQSGALQIAVGSSGLPAPFGLDQRSHDVALLPDQVFDPINLDLGARPFTEQHAVASFDVNRGCACPPSLYPPGITATNSACLGFFRTGIRSDSSRGFLLDLDALDYNPIVKWAEFHGCPSKPLGSAIFACPDSRS
jgi:hypothetical protein